ncbi:hypothetical protein B0H15DRAFT_867773 [Mycena belliarum]|uniref:Transmembrane protein 53 n=1 Tax=Mycena belliarum TaxID=1033014 RepID=A0AAD6XEZ8_9AGAR|nr:hypothetical protein B0H15DRAFT_867773 [Mycena belliae]
MHGINADTAMDAAKDPSISSVNAPRIDLQRLGEDIHICYGNPTGRNSNIDPRVIICFGWMDAPLRVLEKYAVNHRLIWPSSDIIIVQSHSAWIWSGEKKRTETLRPLASYLLSTVYRSPRGSGGVFLHVLSNGGGFQLITLSKVLASSGSESDTIRNRENIRLATVLDSTPGTGEYSSLLSTIRTGVKSAGVRTILTVPVSMLYLVLRARSVVMGEGNLFTRLQSGLQAEELLPRTMAQAPRVYIYSATDSMVPAESVEKHISILTKSSPLVDIETEKFSDSQHILHERKDPSRYWNAVRRVWARSAPARAKL